MLTLRFFALPSRPLVSIVMAAAVPALVLCLLCAGCGDDVEIYKPVGRGNDDPYVPQISPGNVIHNLALSYNLRDGDGFGVLLHEDFVFAFDPDDVRNFPDEIPQQGFWGYPDEVQATCNMFNPDYEPSDPSYKADDIEIHLQLSGPLEQTAHQGAPEGTLEGYVTLDFTIVAGGGHLNLIVRSRPLFFFAPDNAQSPTTWRIWKCEDSPFQEDALSGNIHMDPTGGSGENRTGQSTPGSVRQGSPPWVACTEKSTWGAVKAIYLGD
jgi:hypothetical protein